jgi:hypothetical protein
MVKEGLVVLLDVEVIEPVEEPPVCRGGEGADDEKIRPPGLCPR